LVWRGGRTGPGQVQDPVRVVWAFEAVERGAIVSTPLVTQDRVFLGAIRDQGLSSTGVVYCLSRETGKSIWEFDNDGAMQHMYSSPCLAEGRLYIGEGMHANQVCKLYCLDAETGKKLWDFQTAGHIESSPCVADHKVFFGSGDDGLYCLDAKTGMQRWHFQGPFHIDNSATISGHLLYSGTGISRKYQNMESFCLDTRDGAVVWRFPTNLPVWGSPAVDGDQVFVGLGNGRLMKSVDPPEIPAGAVLCLDRKTGTQHWRFDVSDGVLAKPAVDADRVYFGCRDGNCYAIDRKEGHLCWKENVGSAVVTSPALWENHLYLVPSEGRVCRLDVAHGRVNWFFDVGAHSQTKPRLFSSPTVKRGEGNHRLIYFGAELQIITGSAAVLYCLQD
jgi:eukaryotic-like serine/threonine-protein kinase